jgi:hypothetical protein
VMGSLVLLYLLLFKYLTFPVVMEYFLLYMYLFLVFYVRYEIGYICNDNFTTKKEKDPTLYVRDECSNKFRYTQIMIRVIVGSLLLIPLYVFSFVLFKYFLIILFFVGIVYTIHNTIRNYSINIFTFLWLRTSKFMLFIIVVSVLPLNEQIVNNIIVAVLGFQFMRLLGERILVFNERLWGTNKFLHWYYYLFLILFNALMFFVVGNEFYLLMMISLFPLFWVFLKRYPKAFSAKSER